MYSVIKRNAKFYIHVHDVIGDVEREKERKKERKTPEAMEKLKMRVASGGIRTHDTLFSRQMLYQLSYQGSSAGRVRINISYTCLNRLTEN